jgi:hypothetical protein
MYRQLVALHRRVRVGLDEVQAPSALRARAAEQ